MPSIEHNIARWATHYTWPDAGEEWSQAWGGSEKQWRGTILPRIQQFLPAPSILEIAPGFGRWTKFLIDHCERLIGVDLSANCIEACTRRFADVPHLEFFQNDGRSLAMIADESIDLIFSFDSLVHVEMDVIDDYLAQFKRILTKRGAAFIHHSNFGMHRDANKPNVHGRGENMAAACFRDSCRRHGLRCIQQEQVTWGADFLNDCLSSAVRGDCDQWLQETKIIENFKFMEEAARIKASS